MATFIRFENFTAWVRNVIDGDTFTIERGSLVMNIRLAHCDAPENGQSFCVEARDALRDLIFERWVCVVPLCADRYSRIVATVYDMRGVEISEEMIRKGFAFYVKYKKGRQDLLLLESWARSMRYGIWSVPFIERPWNYRKQKKMIR